MKRFATRVLTLTMLLASATSAQTNPPAKTPAATTAHSSTAARPAASTYDKALLNPALLKATAPAEYDVKLQPRRAISRYT